MKQRTILPVRPLTLNQTKRSSCSHFFSVGPKKWVKTQTLTHATRRKKNTISLWVLNLSRPCQGKGKVISEADSDCASWEKFSFLCTAYWLLTLLPDWTMKQLQGLRSPTGGVTWEPIILVLTINVVTCGNYSWFPRNWDERHTQYICTWDQVTVVVVVNFD